MGLFQSAIGIILATLIVHSVSGQSDNITLGARSHAMGNASVALKDDCSIFNNIGASATIEDISLISSFSHKFGFAPFKNIGVGITYPHNMGVFSLTIRRFGEDLYNEQHIGIGFSNKLGIVSLGLKVNYSQYTVLELGTTGVSHIEFGGVAELLPTLSFGAYIYNLTQAKLHSDDGMSLPVIIKSGFAYNPVDELTICASVEKNIDHDTRIGAGVEYQFFNKFYLRSGISTAPFQQYYGLGFSPYNFSFDYAMDNHNTLGLSHQLSIRYRFFKRY